MRKELNYYYIGDASSIEQEIRTCTIDEAYTYLKDQEVISLDIETTRKFGGKQDEKLQAKYGKKSPRREGLQPHLTKIVMVQMGTKDKQFLIDYRTVDLGKLKYLLIDPSITIVGQNLKFEYLHFLHNEGIRINGIYDTMIAEQLLFNGLSPEASLKALNLKYLGIRVDKTTALEFLSIKDRPFTLRQLEYGAQDILYPLLIRDKQQIDLTHKGLNSCVALEMKFLEVLGDIEYKGMFFNKDKWLETYAINLKKSGEIRLRLDEYILNNYFDTKFVDRQYDMFESDRFECRIGWTSSKQVISFLNYLKACPMEKSKETGKMAYTVNAKVLKSSLNTINRNKSKTVKDFLELYIEFKETQQACTTFGDKFLKHINPVTNRLHSNYTQLLTTGRISSSNPNLQNIPAVDAFRSCFACPTGWKIVNADYSGQEQIILANKSKDVDLIAFYELGFSDMHSFIASKIFKKSFESYLEAVKANKTGKTLTPEQITQLEERQIAKSAGFAINYGGTGFTIANNLGVSEDIGNFVYESYFESFPGLSNFFNTMKKESKVQGYILIDPITGRKFWTGDRKAHKVDKLAQNYPMRMGVITVM